ncbi:MAG: methylenetetrahydrofolate reductase [Candidatus Lambdaproteobacteria bacterium]|nr:methylenetetrahydrofolate reductase [Candidatus Lambdaproteobacteria bacterium]
MPSRDATRPPHAPEDCAGDEPCGRAALLRGWSMEATRPRPAELETLRHILPAGAPLYLSALPQVPPEQLLAHARQVAAAGLAPVPHVAVRQFAGRADLQAFLTELREQARVRRVLLVGGDRDTPAGPFAASLQVLEAGLLEEAGLEGVDIAGYPEGHPLLPDEALREALRAKLAAARRAGLAVQVVTQFCFDADIILRWLRALRRSEPRLAVRIGLSGPASATTLLRYALRCGVRTAARGLGRGLSLLEHAPDEAAAATLVSALAAGLSAAERRDVSLHFYSFGGIARTAAWAQALAQGGSSDR